jgi:hypothetical protein
MNRFCGGWGVHRLAFLTSAFLILATPFHAGAAVTTIYQDTLARPAYNNLGTTQPNTVDTNSNTWTTQAFDGTVQNYLFVGDHNTGADTVVINQYNAYAYLPLTLSLNTTYTVSIQLESPAAPPDTGHNYNPSGIALINSGVLANATDTTHHPPPVGFEPSGSGFVQTYSGTNGGANYTTYSAISSASLLTFQTYSFTLDTATGTVVYDYNGSPVLTLASAFTAGDISSVQDVALFGGDSAHTVAFQNFLVTSTPDLVPEPPVEMMLLLGGAVLDWSYRRRILDAGN